MDMFVHSIPGKYLDRLTNADKERIKKALKGLEKEPTEGDIRPFEGQKGCFRLKVGDYRILYRYSGNEILVTHIDPRGQAYSKKTKEVKNDGFFTKKRIAYYD